MHDHVLVFDCHRIGVHTQLVAWIILATYRNGVAAYPAPSGIEDRPPSLEIEFPAVPWAAKNLSFTPNFVDPGSRR